MKMVLPVKMIGSLQNVSSIKELENELADVRLQRQKEISETIIKVQEKERSRIGHELHDNVNQLLSTVKLFFGGVNTAECRTKAIKRQEHRIPAHGHRRNKETFQRTGDTAIERGKPGK